MKNKHLFSKYLAISLLIFYIFFAGCNDKKEDLGTAPRLFRPILTELETAEGQNWMKASWKKIAGATSFTLDISRDTFKTILSTVTTDTTSWTFENLDWDYNYQVRIKCDGENISSEYFAATKDISYPTFLKALAGTDITDVAVKVQWSNNSSNYTSLKVIKTANDSLVSEIPLSVTDTTNKLKYIWGLKPNTNYKVVVYSGEKYEGRKLFKTVPAQEFAIPVDIREIDDATASTMLTTTYLQGLAEGSTIILKRGMSYVVSGTLYVEKSITFTTGLGFGDNLAVLDLQAGNFNIPATKTVGQVYFKDVNLIGKTAGYAGRYVFNINTSCALGTFIADGCKIQGLRGVVRVQAGPTTIDTVRFNNCAIDSIRDYAVVNSDHAAALIKNIKLTNSTVSDALKLFVNTKSDGTNSIVVENCTFCYLPNGGGNCFFDYTGRSVTNGITISNCIFGPGKSNAGNSNLYGIKGTASCSVSNSYKTSDLVWSTVAIVPMPANIPDLIDYTKTAADLFNKPDLDDFTIKDLTFAGKSSAGDPRWRK